ncbi:MAG: hypothetical protein V1870_04155 [Candidatus Aenigmatarchaeota archaeon]
MIIVIMLVFSLGIVHADIIKCSEKCDRKFTNDPNDCNFHLGKTQKNALRWLVAAGKKNIDPDIFKKYGNVKGVAMRNHYEMVMSTLSKELIDCASGEKGTGENILNSNELKCAEYANWMAQYFGNRLNGGNSWTMHQTNPLSLIWKAYPGNVKYYTSDNQNGAQVVTGDDSRIEPQTYLKPWGQWPVNAPFSAPETSFPYDKLKTGDFVTVKFSINGDEKNTNYRYVTHSAIVLVDPGNCNKKYLISNVHGNVEFSLIRTVNLNGKIAGNYIQYGGGYVLDGKYVPELIERPIIEVYRNSN